MRYIELIPVRAGMVAQPSEYPWSSYRQTALGQPDEIVADYPLYHELGATTREQQTAYRGFFTGQIEDRLTTRPWTRSGMRPTRVEYWQ